ncbi:uncharacterized protein PHA67_009438 isoform 1-T1 [Liasis olivaceus]
MATLQQRKRRRRKTQSRKLVEDSCDLVSAEKKSADIERLAYRYMQKCSVESSTDSESDANVEVLSVSMFTEGPLDRKSHTQLHFVDPYDGDYEEISGNSDCGLDFADTALVYLSHPITEVQAREDNPPEKQVTLSISPPKIVTSKNESEPLQTSEPEPSWFAGPNSEIATSEDVLQPMLTDCDYKFYEDLNINKKQRRSALECGEKLRKRLRVI